jgi:hypothetical protein
VGGSEAKKGPGSDFLIFFKNGVFELPSPRNAQKRDQKNREKMFLDFLSICFVNAFRHDFCCKTFF